MVMIQYESSSADGGRRSQMSNGLQLKSKQVALSLRTIIVVLKKTKVFNYEFFFLAWKSLIINQTHFGFLKYSSIILYTS